MGKKRRLKTSLLLFLSLPWLSMVSQNTDYQADRFFTIVSYHVENLHDTIHYPSIYKKDYQPDSIKQWNTEKYTRKIKDIARVIHSINRNELPELVALLDIENGNVINDIIRNRLLQPGNYDYIHDESTDKRRMGIALLYRKDEFEPIGYERIPVTFKTEPESKSHNILYVKGKAGNGEMLHVFVNHWISDGVDSLSANQRITAARHVRAKVDSIFKKSKKAKIIILGSFYDEPADKSLKEMLNTANNQHSKNYRELYNLMYDKHLLGTGSIHYRGSWRMWDQMIVSRALLNSPGKYEVSRDGGQIFQQRWMMWDNVKTGYLTPLGTYSGTQYLGGISNHLPVYIILKR
jgi:hypothetical protein